MKTIARVFFACLLGAGCAGGNTTDISPPQGDSAAVQVVQPGPTSFGLEARLAHANVQSKACQRLMLKVEKLRIAVLAPRSVPPKQSALHVAIAAATSDMGPFDPLLNGEVHNTFAAFKQGDGINATEATLLVAELGHHLRRGGVSKDKVTAIESALIALSEAGPVETSREKVGELTVDIADFFALLQRCAPKGVMQ